MLGLKLSHGSKRGTLGDWGKISVYDCPSASEASVKNAHGYIDGLVQDYSNSIADALELLQSCT